MLGRIRARSQTRARGADRLHAKPAGPDPDEPSGSQAEGVREIRRRPATPYDNRRRQTTRRSLGTREMFAVRFSLRACHSYTKRSRRLASLPTEKFSGVSSSMSSPALYAAMNASAEIPR